MLRFYREAVTQAQKIGEPSDVLYSEQATAQATQAAQLAFQAARNQAALLAKMNAATTPAGGAAAANKPAASNTSGDNTAAASNNSNTDNDDNQSEPTQQQRFALLRANAQTQLTALQQQDAALDAQVVHAKGKDLAALRLQDEQIEGQVELQKSIVDAFNKVATMADAQATGTGLAGDIAQLLRAAPELGTVAPRPVTAPPSLESLGAARDSGVSSQAVALIQLLTTRHTIDSRIAETQLLSKQTDALRQPMIKLMRSTIAQGMAAMQAAPDPTAKATTAQTADVIRKRYDALAATFRVLSAATQPMSQEMVVLEQSRTNLQNWNDAVEVEYTSLLRSLLIRVASIALALLILVVLGSVWKRLTSKYVTDVRRRRQLLVVRRIVMGFLSGLVVIFGFVSQFSSLATFAGFITAGIAVGLQTILLSVAAYFFIIGRYGVRVGDRITVAGVTGDVIEVGLVRFYLIELTGTGNELHATGRVAVFANSVLFQAGTPLYKQVPGTEYAWHEVTVKLKPETDYKPAMDAVLASVKAVYSGYQKNIENQHQRVEEWMDAAMEAPRIEPRLQMAEDGLQYAVLFPVEMKDASLTDERLVQKLLADIAANQPARDAIAAPPTVKAVVKG